ncbi:alpha-hydroxy-acid oxidizing protein, partial [Salipiger pacificus]|nr:alpha-hydroxy-acid oxidizing protein [Salipiger mangrovisoli]
EAGVSKAIGILKRELHRDIGLLGLMPPGEVSGAVLEAAQLPC